MLKCHVPSVVILLTLLVQWNQSIPHRVDLLLKFIMFSCFHDTIWQYVWDCERPFFPPSRTEKMLYPSNCKDRDFVEVFSGRGEVSRALRDVPWQHVFKHMKILLQTSWFFFQLIHKRPLMAVMKTWKETQPSNGKWQVMSWVWSFTPSTPCVLLIKVGMAGTSFDTCLDEVAFDLTRPSAFGCPAGIKILTVYIQTSLPIHLPISLAL